MLYLSDNACVCVCVCVWFSPRTPSRRWRFVTVSVTISRAVQTGLCSTTKLYCVSFANRCPLLPFIPFCRQRQLCTFNCRRFTNNVLTDDLWTDMYPFRRLFDVQNVTPKPANKGPFTAMPLSCNYWYDVHEKSTNIHVIWLTQNGIR